MGVGVGVEVEVEIGVEVGVAELCKDVTTTESKDTEPELVTVVLSSTELLDRDDAVVVNARSTEEDEAEVLFVSGVVVEVSAVLVELEMSEEELVLVPSMLVGLVTVVEWSEVVVMLCSAVLWFSVLGEVELEVVLCASGVELVEELFSPEDVVLELDSPGGLEETLLLLLLLLLLLGLCVSDGVLVEIGSAEDEITTTEDVELIAGVEMLSTDDGGVTVEDEDVIVDASGVGVDEGVDDGVADTIDERLELDDDFGLSIYS